MVKLEQADEEAWRSLLGNAGHQKLAFVAGELEP